jgi:Flp pilus assembly protein TadD
MGQVYRARDSRLSRNVALKLLTSDLAGDRTALARLRREAETASRLNHPNIVTILDIGDAPAGQIFVAMELIDGISLRQWMRTQHSQVEIAELLSQTAAALAAAHASGVIHRDVKPENIMVTSHGFAKVIDFGLAKAPPDAPTSADTPTSVLTEAGKIVGTVLYMAPEQLRGQPLDGACDVFALGSVLHEALSGRAPFDGGAQVTTITRILNEDPPPLPGSTDPRLVSLVSSMLAKDPAARPSMESVASALRGVTRDREAETVIIRPAKRRRTLVAAVAVILLIASAAGALWMAREEPPAAAPQPKTAAETPADPAVRELWTQAKFFAGDENWNVQDKSIPLLEDVVKRDPDFLPARITLALQYGRRAFASDPDRSWEQKAFLEADRVLQRDPNSPVAHGVLAQLKWTKARGFNHEDSMIEVSRALSVDPGYTPGLFHRGSLLMHVGMFEPAMADFRKLLEVAPAETDVWMRIARIHLWQGETATALRELREYRPNDWQIPIALNELGRRDEAMAFAEQRLQSGMMKEDMLSVHAMLLAAAGRRAEAEKAIARVYETGEESSHFHHALYNVAGAWAQLREEAKAVEVLERVSREGMPCYPLFVRDPMLDPIRSGPRFQQFLAESREAHEQRQRTLSKYLPAKVRTEMKNGK